MSTFISHSSILRYNREGCCRLFPRKWEILILWERVSLFKTFSLIFFRPVIFTQSLNVFWCYSFFSSCKHTKMACIAQIFQLTHREQNVFSNLQNFKCTEHISLHKTQQSGIKSHVCHFKTLLFKITLHELTGHYMCHLVKQLLP